jgi:anti-anti-sigma regulatory factor
MPTNLRRAGISSRHAARALLGSLRRSRRGARLPSARRHEMVPSKSLVLPAADRLTHDEACRLALCAERSSAQTIIIDLSRSQDASTAAFARLVLLRRELLQSGRDLRLAGLRSRAARLFEVHRLDSILPRVSELPSTMTVPRAQRRPTPERIVERPCAFSFACHV